MTLQYRFNAIEGIFDLVDIGTAGVMPYEFVQLAPSALWMVAHSLARFPSVTVRSLAGKRVNAAVEYLDANTLTVEFTSPFSGRAYLI